MTEARQMNKTKFNLRRLRLSLKYRPDILKLILKMRQCIRKKNSMLIILKHQLKEMENKIVKKIKENSIAPCTNNFNQIITEAKEKEIIVSEVQNTKEIILPEVVSSNDTSETVKSDKKTAVKKKPKLKNRSTQTTVANTVKNILEVKETNVKSKESGWKINEENDTKSIAEQVKEAAQDAMKQSGMVYVESAGMYYDYKTGYYYNSELGLYYHTETDCYYYYSEEKQTFVFHSFPDRKATAAQASLLAHEKRKAKKHKMERKAVEEIDNLTKNLSQDGEDAKDEKQPKRKKNKKKTNLKDSAPEEKKDDDISEPSAETSNENNTESKEEEKEKDAMVVEDAVEDKPGELEDGECSDTSSEESGSDDEEVKSNASTATASDDETIARHHPPCMRVIVRETTLPKLRIGSLFIVTKDGGTIGREGEQHTILLSDSNVSRCHMNIIYDVSRRSYIAVDLGSKNGSILNGNRMSESQIMSEPTEIVHGSTLQLGETKLLCHIHPGNDTCGHCEPGLLMEALEKEKKAAYTRTCSVKKQHELELARLKNKYAKPQLAIEETAYNDRAQARRETVGSSHHAEKTQTSDIDTSIATDNKGFKLLEKMGWSQGEGLGKDNQGDVEPVPLVSNEGKTGLGAIATPQHTTNRLGPATLRLATRTKMLQPPAKAFQGMLDEDSE